MTAPRIRLEVALREAIGLPELAEAVYGVAGRLLPAGFAYRSAVDFALREGEWFVPQRLPPDVARGLPRKCFHNSIMQSAVRGFAYVEGFAINGLSTAAIPHAWNADGRRVIDSTWVDEVVPPEDRAYLGVRFSAARAHDATWHGDAAILQDHNRGWPVFREPWAGEGSPGELDGLLERMFAELNGEGYFPAHSADEFVASAHRVFGPRQVAA